MVEVAGWPTRLVNTAQLAALAAVERRVPFWPGERVERFQRWRLGRIVHHAYETVPFYREAMDERGLRPEHLKTAADLARLPLIDGELVRRDSEQFASTRYDDRSRHPSRTTGTRSHVQKVIWWDDAAVQRKLARAERDRGVLATLAGSGWGQRQLYILPATGHAVKLRELWDARTLGSRRLGERRAISPELPFEAIVDELDRFRPHVVFSVGSFADHFFRLVADRGPTITLPRVWVYGGDMLSPGGRERIESFGRLVSTTYQEVETGRLGFECERRAGFHLNVDLVAVRVVDDAGRDVPPGVAGELVVSNLVNRATVLLNYRLGDLATIAPDPCLCGRSLPLLSALHGRNDEVITLPSGRVVHPQALRMVFMDEEQVWRYQIVQETPGRFSVAVVADHGVDRSRLRERVAAGLAARLADPVTIEVTFVEAIARTAGGKVQPIVSRCRGGTSPGNGRTGGD